MPIVLIAGFVSLFLQIVIYIILNRRHGDICRVYFENGLLYTTPELQKKAASFYCVPWNWKPLCTELKLLLSINFCLYIFVFYKFFIEPAIGLFRGQG